ncbi:MAG: hypothetical protein HC880_11900 [Bacteroidia bacterium]|nr:hypothetical protein [Bacteroidia bacterium]
MLVHPHGGHSPYAYSLDGVNFQWDNYFDNLAEGTYQVYVQDKNGCLSTQAGISLDRSFIGQSWEGIAVIYPNPNAGTFVLRILRQDLHGLLNVELRDGEGQILQKTNFC